MAKKILIYKANDGNENNYYAELPNALAEELGTDTLWEIEAKSSDEADIIQEAAEQITDEIASYVDDDRYGELLEYFGDSKNWSWQPAYMTRKEV